MPELWLGAEEWGIVWLTLAVAARSVVFCLPVAIVAAFLVGRGRFPGRMALDAFVHLPLALPPVVVGWMLLLVLGLRGPIGHWLYQWFGIRLVFTSTGASVACAVMSLPLAVRAIRLSVEGVDAGLEAAARTLGAGRFDRFATIVLPLALPGIVVGALAAFAAALGEFGAVITFAANIPGETQTLPLAIYAALQTPGGEVTATRLSLAAIVLALGALSIADLAGRRARRLLGGG